MAEDSILDDLKFQSISSTALNTFGGGAENTGPENAGLENAGPNRRA